MHRMMRSLARCLVAAAVAALSACGGADRSPAGPAPTPAASPGGILGPAERARTTVDQLNEQQRAREGQTGGYDP